MTKRKKTAGAVALGWLGGLKDGMARTNKLTPDERRKRADRLRAARIRYNCSKGPSVPPPLRGYLDPKFECSIVTQNRLTNQLGGPVLRTNEICEIMKS